MRNKRDGSVQSVSRAVDLLEALSDGEEHGVTELGKQLRVHKATASRLLATLAQRRLVYRNPATDKYRLGLGLIHLAGSAMAGIDLIGQARPILEDLAATTSETVNLAVLDGNQVMHIDQIAGTRTIVNVSWVGRRTPLHCTANGKVLLAFLEAPERDRMLAPPLEALTGNTITSRRKLERQLTEIRGRGYARAIEELEDGLNVVAAPVRGADGGVVAAVSVGGPAFRMRPRELGKLGRMAMDAGAAISRRMGFVKGRRSNGST